MFSVTLPLQETAGRNTWLGAHRGFFSQTGMRETGRREKPEASTRSDDRSGGSRGPSVLARDASRSLRTTDRCDRRYTLCQGPRGPEKPNKPNTSKLKPLARNGGTSSSLDHLVATSATAFGIENRRFWNPVSGSRHYRRTNDAVEAGRGITTRSDCGIRRLWKERPSSWNRSFGRRL